MAKLKSSEIEKAVRKVLQSNDGAATKLVKVRSMPCKALVDRNC